MEDWRDVGVAEREARLARVAARRSRARLRARCAAAAAPDARCARRRRSIVSCGRSITRSSTGAASRWCCARCSTSYDAAQRGEAAPVPERRRPFREYVEWLGTRDLSASDAFWRERLAGITARDADSGGARGAGARASWRRETRSVASSAEVVARCATLARDARRDAEHDRAGRVGARAEPLQRRARRRVRRDARRPSRHGRRCGRRCSACSSTRCRCASRCADDAPVGEWLRDVRAAWTALREHEHTPLSRVQRAARCRRGSRCSRASLMFESYELEASLQRAGRRVDAARIPAARAERLPAHARRVRRRGDAAPARVRSHALRGRRRRTHARSSRRRRSRRSPPIRRRAVGRRCRSCRRRSAIACCTSGPVSACGTRAVPRSWSGWRRRWRARRMRWRWRTSAARSRTPSSTRRDVARARAARARRAARSRSSACVRSGRSSWSSRWWR